MTRRGMKGAKKRQCSVCLHRVFYTYASPFELARVENGRAPGSARLSVPAGALICGVCLDANPTLVSKVNDVPLAYETKQCHRCGGSKRVPSVDRVGQWGAGPADTMPCPRCNGSGEVAA